MILKIYDDELLGVNILVGTQTIQEFLSFEERLNALVKANQRLDVNVAEVWDTFKSQPLGLYAWSITDDYHLHDSFRSGRKNTVIWYYYLLELVKVVDKKCKVSLIIVDSIFVPKEVIYIFRLNSFLIQRQIKPYVLNLLVIFGYELKYIKAFFLFIFGFFGKKFCFNSEKPCVLVDISDNKSDHRYGAYLDKLKMDYDLLFFNIKKGFLFKNNERYRIVSFLEFIDVYSALKNVILFKKSVISNKNNISNDNIFFGRVKRSNPLFLFRNFLLIISLRRLFSCKKIDLTIVRSCLNDNLRKIIPLCSKENEIPCVYFIPRPLTTYRPAERILKHGSYDLEKQILPDFYQVRDHHSYEVLISQGIDSVKIIESDREMLGSDVIQKNINKNQVNCSIIILLGGIGSVNEKLINLLNRLVGFDTLLVSVRAHPAQPLTSSQRISLSRNFPNWFDASNVSYDAIPARYKIVISSSSTATVEAAKSNCGVVWCPFVEEQSLLMYPIMKKFGEVAKDESDFYNFISMLLESEKKIQEFIMVSRNKAISAFSAAQGVDDGYHSLTKAVFDFHKKMLLRPEIQSSDLEINPSNRSNCR